MAAGLALVRLCFGHQVAWLVAPTLGSPSVVGLQWFLVRLAKGSALELALESVWLVQGCALESGAAADSPASCLR